MLPIKNERINPNTWGVAVIMLLSESEHIFVQCGMKNGATHNNNISINGRTSPLKFQGEANKGRKMVPTTEIHYIVTLRNATFDTPGPPLVVFFFFIFYH